MVTQLFLAGPFIDYRRVGGIYRRQDVGIDIVVYGQIIVVTSITEVKGHAYPDLGIF